MSLPSFTLIAGDGFASRIGVTRETLSGAVLQLKSNIKSGELLRVGGGMERIETVTIALDEDGKINGDEGIDLLAVEAFEALEWQVSVVGAKSQGFSRVVNSFTFDAGRSGSTVRLDEQVPEPGSDPRRGPRGYDITDVAVTPDNELVFTRADGVELGPVSADVSADVLPQAMGRAVAFAIALG